MYYNLLISSLFFPFSIFTCYTGHYESMQKLVLFLFQKLDGADFVFNDYKILKVGLFRIQNVSISVMTIMLN